MKKSLIYLAAACLVAAAFGPADAQMMNMLNNATGSSGSMGGLGSMGGMSIPSLGSTTPTNLAGVLQYCVQNNYLGGASASSASSVKDSLLSKFTGSSSDPSSNTGFTSGSNGILNTGNGQSTTLGGTGLKAQLTQKLCGQVLKHGQSLL